MADTIILISDAMSADVLQTTLEQEISDPAITFHVERTRSADMALLVAIVGASGTAIAALIAGILKIAVQRSSQRIIIRGKSGRTIEVPVHLPPEELDEIVRKAKELDMEQIVL